MAAPPKFVQCFDGLGFSQRAIEYLWANREKDAPLTTKKVRKAAEGIVDRKQLEEVESEAAQWYEVFYPKEGKDAKPS